MRFVFPHHCSLIDNADFQLSDWDRFAAEEYELLVAEEGNNEPMDDM